MYERINMKGIRYYWPAIVWTAIILLLTLMPASDVPNTFLSKIPHFDKVVHAGIFALFVILWFACVRKYFIIRYPEDGGKRFHPVNVLAIIILIAILLGLLIEVTQKEWKSIHRDFEWFDWVADIIGAFFGGAIANEIFKIKPVEKK